MAGKEEREERALSGTSSEWKWTKRGGVRSKE